MSIISYQLYMGKNRSKAVGPNQYWYFTACTTVLWKYVFPHPVVLQHVLELVNATYTDYMVGQAVPVIDFPDTEFLFVLFESY